MSRTTIVETTSGRVRGRVSGSNLTFKGIPYARDPVGLLRFAPPQPPVPWSETLDALDFGPVAPQPVAPLEVLLGGGNAPQSESRCLTLNVWTPGLDDARRPVMVWVHGGAFLTGSGSAPWYDGSSLAGAGDVVVVTFNYRLGALGYIYLGGPDVSCNFGLLDQLAVLEWVRENAPAFGGDPEMITVFGQSAGAMSIGAMFGTTVLPGLVRRAILQSGACSHTLSPQLAASNSAALLDRLGLAPGVPDLLESLRALPTAAFLDAQAAQLPVQVDGMSFLPVVDGATLSREPLHAVREGSVSGLDILVGTNADEARIFTLSDPALSALSEDGLLALSSEIWGDLDEARRAIDIYRRARPDGLARDVWAAITTDKTFRIPAVRLAEAQARARVSAGPGTGAPGPGAWGFDSHDTARAATFAYLFKWKASVFDGVFGACHSLEIPFVFDNLDQPGMSMLTSKAGPAGPRLSRSQLAGGADGWGGPASHLQDELTGLAARMRGAWVAFARTGRPVVDGCDPWPPYLVAPSLVALAPGPSQSGTSDVPYRATMSLDITCSVVVDPDAEERRLWEAVV